MADRLTVWCLASFNVAALTVVGVLSLHTLGDLGDLLAGLDTVTGLALYLALWVLTLWTNRRALAGVRAFGSGPGLRPLAGRSFGWGAATGVAFLWAIVAIVYLPDAPGPGSLLAAALGVLGVLLLASAFAALVGALVGLVVGALDLLLLRTARAVAGGPERT